MMIESLQIFGVYVSAKKDRQETGVGIKYFTLFFDNGDASIIGAPFGSDEIIHSTKERKIKENEKGVNTLNICVKHNTKWYIKVSQLIIENQEIESGFPHGNKIKNKLRYLSDVKMHYRNWFELKRLPIPTTNIRMNPDFNPRGDYSELRLEGDFFEVRSHKVQGFITFLFDEYDAGENFNGTKAVKEYFLTTNLQGQVNFYKLFKDAGDDKYIRLKNKLFIPRANRSREYRINPNYLISS